MAWLAPLLLICPHLSCEGYIHTLLLIHNYNKKGLIGGAPSNRFSHQAAVAAAEEGKEMNGKSAAPSAVKSNLIAGTIRKSVMKFPGWLSISHTIQLGWFVRGDVRPSARP